MDKKIKPPKIIASVTTDLVTDQRVNKICTSLQKNGFEVLVVGRKLRNSLPMTNRPYAFKRFSLLFEKGALFYAFYNLRLFWFLLFHKADILIANDLDTLLPNYIVARLKGIPLAYDNHEYFTGVPELVKRPRVQKIWKTIERNIFPKLRYIYTDNDSKKKLFEEEYNVPVRVVMNVPVYDQIEPNKATIPLKLPDNKKIIIYQGTGINIDRGTEELTQAMQYLDDSYLLLFVGSGDVIETLQSIVKKLHLENRVMFTGKVPFEVLQSYTQLAHLGISFDKPISENYIYSLPNKIFDYVHAGVPVLCSRLVEIEKMVTKYDIGTFIESHDPQHIAEKINEIFHTDGLLDQWKSNLPKAAMAVNWQQQEKVLLGIYDEIKKDIQH